MSRPSQGLRILAARVRMALRGPYGAALKSAGIVGLISGPAYMVPEFRVYWTLLAFLPMVIFLILLTRQLLTRGEPDQATPESAPAGTMFQLRYHGLPSNESMVISLIHPQGYMSFEAELSKSPHDSESLFEVGVGTSKDMNAGWHRYRISAGGVTKEIGFELTQRRRLRLSSPWSGMVTHEGPEAVRCFIRQHVLLRFAGLPSKRIVEVAAVVPDGRRIIGGEVFTSDDGTLDVLYYPGAVGDHIVEVSRPGIVRQLKVAAIS